MQYIEMQHACRLWLLKVNNSRDHEHSLLWQFYGASLNVPAVVDIVVVAHLVSRSFRHLHFTMAWDLFRLLVFGFSKWNLNGCLCALLPGCQFTIPIDWFGALIIIECHMAVTTLQAMWKMMILWRNLVFAMQSLTTYTYTIVQIFACDRGSSALSIWYELYHGFDLFVGWVHKINVFHLSRDRKTAINISHHNNNASRININEH